tara:strand:- start:3231 stop:4532 length:1302 start_codon:yes stop_codon:yes gene_type:complete
MKGNNRFKKSFVSKEIFSVRNFTGFAFFMFAVFLPLHTGISNFLLIISLALVLLQILRSKKKVKFAKRWKILLFTLLPFFFLHLIGLSYSEKPIQGLSYIERSLSFLLVPFILLFATKSNIYFFRSVVLRGLIFGSALSLTILLAINLYNYFMVQKSFHIGIDLFDYYHTYLKFTQPLDQHPTYLGIYYLTAIIFINEFLRIKSLKYLILVLFGFGFLFLNSRIISGLLFVWFLFYLVRLINLVYLKKNYSKLILIFVVLIVGSIATVRVMSKSYIGSRIKNIYKFELSSDTKVNFNSHSESNPRMARYISSYKLIKEKPIYGHGTTGEKINLKNQFILDGLTLAAEQNYNSHNQYLGFTIRYGLIGLFVLLFFFCCNFYLAWSSKNRKYLFFIFMIASVCFFENYFDRNFGITFAAVFFTLFSYNVLLKDVD